MDERRSHSLSALFDFRAARQRALVEDILARISGNSSDLLVYDEVRRLLHLQGAIDRGLRDIPLDAIVGSVGRYADFNRHFLPRRWDDRIRWSRVWDAVDDPRGVPPIDVYQIGNVYFVQDGNHRVSVARSLNASHIQARVTEIRTRVPLTPDVTTDDLIIKSEQIAFLEQTRADELVPDADFRLTAPGQYQALLAHIEAERRVMERKQGRAIDSDEALRRWYRTAYLPTAQSIRELGLLRDFPGRSETDLYLWIAEHRAELEQEVGWTVGPRAVAADLASRHSLHPARVVARLGEQLLELVRPETFAPGPPPGAWRRQRQPGDDERLVADMLIPIRGDEITWRALDAALALAAREGGRLHGLHIVGEEHQRAGAAATAVVQRFEARCAAAGIAGNCSIAVSRDVVATICARARWADLVVVQAVYPPEPDPLSRLRSGLRALLQRCPQPLLVLPMHAEPQASFSHALLSYDGSPKAEEALFAAAYLALRWQIKLSVLTVAEGARAEATLAQARTYLDERDVTASYLAEPGPVPETILSVAAAQGCDLIVSGGYGKRPELEIMLGSTLDHLLRAGSSPLLICR